MNEQLTFDKWWTLYRQSAYSRQTNNIRDVALTAWNAARENAIIPVTPSQAALEKLRPYIAHHARSCNLTNQQAWDEAMEALTDLPPEVRADPAEMSAISQAQHEVAAKRSKCTCGLEELLRELDRAPTKEEDRTQTATQEVHASTASSGTDTTDEQAGASATSVPLIAYTDGGARGNPGPAGCGVWFEDVAGTKIAELSLYIGEQTNNVAEYHGLIAALEFASANGHKDISVFSDSEVMVRQILGTYKVKDRELHKLHARALELVRNLTKFQISHIPREQNTRAHKLVNQAINLRK